MLNWLFRSACAGPTLLCGASPSTSILTVYLSPDPAPHYTKLTSQPPQKVRSVKVEDMDNTPLLPAEQPFQPIPAPSGSCELSILKVGRAKMDSPF